MLLHEQVEYFQSRQRVVSVSFLKLRLKDAQNMEEILESQRPIISERFQMGMKNDEQHFMSWLHSNFALVGCGGRGCAGTRTIAIKIKH